MQLTRALEQATSPRSRARGAEYFKAGSVVHFDPQPGFVYAVVHGGEDYVVRLELADRTIRGTCTCPFFNDRLEPCKHLWAVALMCDAERALQPPDTIRAGEVAFVGVPLDDDRDDDWTMDDPEFHTPRSAAQSAAHPAGTRGPGWRQALAAIAARSRPEGDPLDTLAGQILYVIDLAASTQAMALALHLLRQEQKQNGDWGLPKAAR